MCLYSTQLKREKEVGQKKTEEKQNMFREGGGRTARNYISISLISVSRKNGNTDKLEASRSGEGKSSSQCGFGNSKLYHKLIFFPTKQQALRMPTWQQTLSILTFMGLLMHLYDI